MGDVRGRHPPTHIRSRPFWDLGRAGLPIDDIEACRRQLADLFTDHGLDPDLLTGAAIHIRSPDDYRLVHPAVHDFHHDYLSLPDRDCYIVTWATTLPTRLRTDDGPGPLTLPGHVYVFDNMAFEHAGPPLDADISERWHIRTYVNDATYVSNVCNVARDRPLT